MKGTKVGVCAVVLGLVGLVACSSGGGGGGSAGAGSLDTFIAQYCDVYAPCCSRINKPYDQAKCRALITAFVPPNQTYDPAKGQRCLDAARAEAARPEFCESGLSDAGDAACDGVISGSGSGTKKPGEPCESDGECASEPGAEPNCASTFANGATTRTCQIQTRGKEGEPCGGTKDGSATITSGSSSGSGGPPQRIAICHTADGLHCESVSKTCKRVAEIGGECSSSSQNACVDAAYCDLATKKCVARIPVGGDCSATGASTRCIDKSYCDTQSKKCTASLPKDAPCTQSSQCEGKSCVNGKCASTSINATTNFICAQ